MSSIPAPHEPDDCDEYERKVERMSVGEVLSELLYISYATNRDAAPHLTAAQWAPHFPEAEALEARYQAEKALLKARFT